MAEERDPVDIVTNKLPMVDPALRRLWAAEILTELHDNGWRIVKTTQPYAYKHVIWDEWKPPAADAAGVAAGPQATPDPLWEGPAEELDAVMAVGTQQALGCAPTDRVRVVAVPTDHEDPTNG